MHVQKTEKYCFSNKNEFKIQVFKYWPTLIMLVAYECKGLTMGHKHTHPNVSPSCASYCLSS